MQAIKEVGLNKLLLVIDMQEDFFSEGRLAKNRAQFTDSLNELLSEFRKKNQSIIWVRQMFKNDLSDSYLALRHSG